MTETIRQLTEAEKALEIIQPSQKVQNDSFSPEEDDPSVSNIQKIDTKFQNIFYNVVNKMWEAQQASDASEYEKFTNWLSMQRKNWEDAKDDNARTILHAALENRNMTLVKTLFSAGVNVNVKEKCGATPLTLAVIRKDEDICPFLLSNFAVYSDYFFSTIPSPHSIARQTRREKRSVISTQDIANMGDSDNKKTDQGDTGMTQQDLEKKIKKEIVKLKFYLEEGDELLEDGAYG
ncbi:hypothetical protein ACROYT_G014382 [Oculina patagonica]